MIGPSNLSRDNEGAFNPLRHGAAVLLALATWGLIFVGGLVTSTHSGLSVPDWPLSYGRLMPPLVGGILFEHGHRLVATAVGGLTVAVVVLFRREPRGWLRRAAGAALGLVILQGVLGGLTVLLRLPKPISIAHGTIAQTFFCLTVALAVWTLPAWKRSPRREEHKSDVPLTHIALLLGAALYVRLLLGAVVRHTGHAVNFHLLNAGLIFFGIGWLFYHLTTDHLEEPILWRWALGLGAVFLVQVFLRAVTLMVLTVTGWPLNPLSAALWATAHVMGGALLLGFSVVLFLLCWRRFSGDFTSRWMKDYLTLTKPGLSVMAAATALAGFLLGSSQGVDLFRLGHTVLGTLLVSAGACALSMLFERDVDARMRRAAARPLPAQRFFPGEALFVGVLLLAGGGIYLVGFVNSLTAGVAGLTAGVYLYVYTSLKKVSALNTVAGAVAGALPPVMGWTAATGRFGAGAWVLFAILFFWQFPHFFSLAWLYREDYARAGLSMLPEPVGDGRGIARRILGATVALWGASLLPVVVSSVGRFYAGVAALLGTGLLVLGVSFLRQRSAPRARRLFLASVFYLPLLLAVLAFDGVGRTL